MLTLEKIYLILNHDKYITAQEFDKFVAENFAARLAQAKLAIKADVADIVKKIDFYEKEKKSIKRVTSNKTNHVETEKRLTDLAKKLYKCQKKDMIFCEADYQNFLDFSPIRSSLTLNNNEKLLTGCRPKYHLKE